jgi:hypothetical protein
MQEMLVLPTTLPLVTVYVHATNEARRQQIHSPQQQSQTRQQQPPKQRCSDQTPKEKRIAQTTDERKKRGPELVLKGRYLYRTLYPPVKKTLKGRMLDRFLPNLDLGTDWAKQIKLTQLHSYGSQRGRRAKMLRGRCDRLVHGDPPRK